MLLQEHMLTKSINALVEADLLELVTDKVRESKTIEYKQILPGTSDREKKEFLADVSSFANTLGGDLLYGIAEHDGVPSTLTGIDSGNLDEEQRRLNSILERGLDPRARYSSTSVPLSNGRSVFVIRVERSWIGPHRVVFQEHDRFYGRNSGGKYPLDLGELRLAFAHSETTAQKMHGFRVDRVMALLNGDAPVPLGQGAKLIFHVLPLVSFAGTPVFDVIGDVRHPRSLPVIDHPAPNFRINLDGVVWQQHSEHSPEYTQVFRNGVIEAVLGNAAASGKQGGRFVRHEAYEHGLVRCLPRYFEELQNLGCPGPVFVSLAMTGAKGACMLADWRYPLQHGIDRDTFLLPEIEVNDYSEPPERILKPLFDMVWNACGFAGSLNYDEVGNWASRG